MKKAWILTDAVNHAKVAAMLTMARTAMVAMAVVVTKKAIAVAEVIHATAAKKQWLRKWKRCFTMLIAKNREKPLNVAFIKLKKDETKKERAEMLSLFITIFKNYDTNYDTKSKKWLKYWSK
ncbi:MAG: hypothetical protein J6S23_01635 [Clostridia bacterium]|nr:hypothetical protein [Clostridia bacterium]